MSNPRNRDVEQKRSLEPGTILRLWAVFGMLLLLLAGNVSLYEKKEEARLLNQELQQKQQELSELRQELSKKEPLRAQAEALGLEEIDPKKVRILHIKSPRGK